MTYKPSDLASDLVFSLEKCIHTDPTVAHYMQALRQGCPLRGTLIHLVEDLAREKADLQKTLVKVMTETNYSPGETK